MSRVWRAGICSALLRINQRIGLGTEDMNASQFKLLKFGTQDCGLLQTTQLGCTGQLSSSVLPLYSTGTKPIPYIREVARPG